MATKKTSGQTFGTRRVRFHGREWRIMLTDCRQPEALEARDSLGSITRDKSLIEVAYVDREQALITMIHELLHASMPRASERSIEDGQHQVKDALEALGVDLSPLLDGYSK